MSGTCQEHINNMSETYKKHVRNLSGTYQEHVSNMSGTGQEYARNMSGTVPMFIVAYLPSHLVLLYIPSLLPFISSM